MNTPSKTLIRSLVIAGLLAWPGVEMFRLVATQQAGIESA